MKYNIGDIVNFEYNDCIFLDGEIKGFYVGETYDDVIGYYILLNENMYLIKREEVHPKPKPLIFTTKNPYTWFGNEEWIEKEIDKELVWHNGFILQETVKDVHDDSDKDGTVLCYQKGFSGHCGGGFNVNNRDICNNNECRWISSYDLELVEPKKIDEELMKRLRDIKPPKFMTITSNPSEPNLFKYYHLSLDDIDTSKNRIPDNVFFNDKKKATTLMFGKEATVVKCGKDDEYSRRIGFLEAYFQATCGLSKTKAKKYLENIVKDKEEK